MALDPGNQVIRGAVAGNLVYARRTAEALQFVNRYPDDASLQFVRALLIVCNTGRTDAWRAALDQANETISDPVTMLDQNFALLTIEHRYADVQKLLDDVSVTSTRVNPFGGGLFGVGERPIAEYRGWTALLLKDSATAATQGRAVLDFVANQKETKWNAWYLRLLTAEGLTFLGQRERAIAAARKTLELMPPSRDALGWVSAAGSAAAVYAWAGAQDEAVALLEELSTARPGLEPPWITRDPTYAVPLAKNPRYQALVSRLEAQMRRNRAALIAGVPGEMH
jgi:tetratricopeptide (TPR) repeat protein